MEKNCLHCGTGFSTNRESKKYCNEKCKQMAYLMRNGLVRAKLSGVENLPTAVSHVNPLPVVSAVKDVKAIIDVKTDTVKTVKDSSADLEALLTRFTETIDRKIENAVTGIKREIATVSQRLNGLPNALDVVPTKPICHIQPIESLVPKAITIEEIQQDEAQEAEQHTSVPEWRQQEQDNEDNEEFEDEEDYNEQEDLTEHPETVAFIDFPDYDNEEEQETDEQEEREHQIDYEQERESQKKNETPKTEQAELKQNNAYVFIRSEFLQEVEKYDKIAQGGLIFRYMPRHWDSVSVNCVQWVNYRLRCLTECLLKLSNLNSVDRGSIQQLNKAFIKVVKSQSYQFLPPDYPYTNFIAELAAKLSNATGTGYANDIRIKFTPPKRAALTAIRKHLVNCTPAVKFSELDFHEHPKLFVLPEKEKPEADKADKKDESEQNTKQAA